MNRQLGASQWTHPALASAAISPPAPAATTDPRLRVLNELNYDFDGRNGVDPARFQARDAASNLLGSLPSTIDEFKDTYATSRALLFGPPASGKTSIMGHIYVTLKARYHPVPVYYVRAFERNSATLRDEVHHAIANVKVCVVLLDDAHVWYDYRDFFGLFKGTGRALVAAATYSVYQINPTTPVAFDHREKTNMAQHEITALLGRLGVDPTYNAEMVEWYGDIYGRYHFLVPSLMRRWGEMKQENPNATLVDTFFAAATMQDDENRRFLPALDAAIKPIVRKIWDGTATNDECDTLVPYGILETNREWSCEYVRRKYFFDLFQSDENVLQFNQNNDLPGEVELARIGLAGIEWNRLKMSSESSSSGFPVEDIWQSEFYSAIGKCIPRPYTFCKEYATASGRKTGSVDFVLRNGGTRAIEFLIKSDRVSIHHERFETGAYNNLRLKGTYLVVDIKPWGNDPDLHAVSDERRLEIATACFRDAALDKIPRRLRHAVFLVSNDLSRGILYTYNSSSCSAEAVQPSGR